MKFMAAKRKRHYVKAARAESEAETRDRIVAAVVSLHEEIGPARTSVSAIAEKAGVQRLTVYRHFADEETIFAACSARWNGEHPTPDFAAIDAADPRRRARGILTALYSYYRGGEKMLASVLADAPRLPSMGDALAPLRRFQESVVAELERSWRGRSARRTATLRHAVDFATWRSLKALTKDDAEAAELVLRWCDGV